MRGERWWWLAGFLFLSVMIHILLALHGPGFGLKNGFSASPKEIELTLEPLPPAKKAKVVVVKAKLLPLKVAKLIKPKPVPKLKPKPTPKVAIKPLPVRKFIVPLPLKSTPQLRITKAAPTVKAVKTATHPERRVAAEALPEQAPTKIIAVTPHLSHLHLPMPQDNPLAALTTPDDQPQASAAHTETPRLTRTADARSGLSGGISGGGHSAAHGPQTPTEQPSDSGLPGGMHFPRMAARVGGQSIMSVNNPLAEDAVPEEKPGFSTGAGGHPGTSQGSRGGLNGKMLATLRTGIGSGLGGGIGGGRGTGHGKGSGSGRGAGHGTGAGRSGSGNGAGIDEPGISGEGYGRMEIGYGTGAGGSGYGRGGGRRVASGGSGKGAFGNVGGLLRGDPPRTPGDGRAGRDGHGLNAEIYEGQPYLTTLTHHRTDAFIDFNWGTSAAIIHGVSRLFSVRWSGQIASQYSENYTFVSLEDDGLRVWVNGKPVIDDWNDHKPEGRRGSIFLEAGRKYDIKIEYFENGLGHAEVHLRWESPSQPLEVVPESAFWQAK